MVLLGFLARAPHPAVETRSPWFRCNGYPAYCMGYGGAAVGHEAAYGVLEQGGQCQENLAIGNW